MRVRVRLKIVVLMMVLHGWHGAGYAQDTADGVLARLKGKQLYFRGMFGENKMSFDSAGKPLGQYTPIPFTEAGMSVTSAKLVGDQLVLKGRRMGLEFPPKGKPSWVRVEAKDYDPKIELRIGGVPGTDFSRALDAIFASDLASLTPVLPSYWHEYAVAHFLAGEPSRNASRESAVKLADLHDTHGPMRPPKILESKELEYTPVAKELKFSGIVTLSIQVLENGSVTHLRVVRPAGLGLDEQAIKAVSGYKFSPATLSGQPVKVDIYIDVNFEIL